MPSAIAPGVAVHRDGTHETPKVIFIVGPPGTGKSTLTHHLSAQLGYGAFLSGHALRETAKNGAGPLKERVSARLSKNQSMPIDLYCEVISAAIDGRTAPGLIIDGY